jgi:hypothetical protein
MIDERELVWLARYNDGSYHTQYNVDGTYRDRYADIVRKELKTFELWKPDMKTLILRIHFDTPDKKLIWRRRVFKQSNGTEYFLYLAGWQQKIGGENTQSINVVFPDMHVELIDRWAEKNNPLFVYFEPPTLHPHEGEDWEPHIEKASN